MPLKDAIARVVAGQDLGSDEIAEVFGAIMEGKATAAQIGGLLIGLRMKGETAGEIAGAARAMRARATPFSCPEPEFAVDTCGTGGDGSGSVNVSTIAAIVAAAAGARVAKHGNRALSSRSGSADVLEALGVAIDMEVARAERCLREVHIAFLFAPAFHAATRHAAGPRRELGTRTLFNLLGPLTNPAGVENQIVGVFDGFFCEPVARALGQLGARRAYVVHGHGGIDEIAVRGPTRMAEWDRQAGEVRMREVTPGDFGLDEADPAELAGADAAYNAEIARRVLAGQAGAVRNAVIMEAAVALCAAGSSQDFREGAERAIAAIDRGEAMDTLARWIALSREQAQSIRSDREDIA
jgi:anthranilate phosphoribosyltransferase